ncbi:MAG TPA: glycosyltransferase [Myxococcota bacterium]|nr:glycosyltransferase [Myxococcota bacterium]
MSRLRIYALFGDAGRYAGQVSLGEKHEMHFSSCSFDNLVERTGLDSIRARRSQIDRVLDEMEGFDAVFSDSPDLMLLHYVRRKRKMRPIPWLVNEVDRFGTAGLVRRFVEDHYGDDPFPGALRAGEVLWFTIVPGLDGYYRNMGIPAENIFYLPMARASVGFFLPELVRAQDRVLAGSEDDWLDCPISPGAILAMGSHERDYSCLAEALSGTGHTAEIICNLSLYRDRPEGPLIWHDSVPAEAYVEAIRRASMVVLPLRPVDRALGQMSCALPMRLGKAIVATQMPSLSAHIRDGENGLTYPVGDAQALRRCMLRLAGDGVERSRLGAAASRRERELSEVAEEAIVRIVEHLIDLSGAP